MAAKKQTFFFNRMYYILFWKVGFIFTIYYYEWYDANNLQKNFYSQDLLGSEKSEKSM